MQVLYKHVRGGGGLKEMLILLMWLGGSRGKMILLLRIKILIHLKLDFKSEISLNSLVKGHK